MSGRKGLNTKARQLKEKNDEREEHEEDIEMSSDSEEEEPTFYDRIEEDADDEMTENELLQAQAELLSVSQKKLRNYKSKVDKKMLALKEHYNYVRASVEAKYQETIADKLNMDGDGLKVLRTHDFLRSNRYQMDHKTRKHEIAKPVVGKLKRSAAICFTPPCTGRCVINYSSHLKKGHPNLLSNDEALDFVAGSHAKIEAFMQNNVIIYRELEQLVNFCLRANSSSESDDEVEKFQLKGDRNNDRGNRAKKYIKMKYHQRIGMDYLVKYLQARGLTIVHRYEDLCCPQLADRLLPLAGQAVDRIDVPTRKADGTSKYIKMLTPKYFVQGRNVGNNKRDEQLIDDQSPNWILRLKAAMPPSDYCVASGFFKNAVPGTIASIIAQLSYYDCYEEFEIIWDYGTKSELTIDREVPLLWINNFLKKYMVEFKVFSYEERLKILNVLYPNEQLAQHPESSALGPNNQRTTSGNEYNLDSTIYLEWDERRGNKKNKYITNFTKINDLLLRHSTTFILDNNTEEISSNYIFCLRAKTTSKKVDDEQKKNEAKWLMENATKSNIMFLRSIVTGLIGPTEEFFSSTNLDICVMNLLKLLAEQYKAIKSGGEIRSPNNYMKALKTRLNRHEDWERIEKMARGELNKLVSLELMDLVLIAHIFNVNIVIYMHACKDAVYTGPKITSKMSSDEAAKIHQQMHEKISEKEFVVITANLFEELTSYGATSSASGPTSSASGPTISSSVESTESSKKPKMMRECDIDNLKFLRDKSICISSQLVYHSMKANKTIVVMPVMQFSPPALPYSYSTIYQFA